MRKVFDQLNKIPKPNGLYSVYVHPQYGGFTKGNNISYYIRIKFSSSFYLYSLSNTLSNTLSDHVTLGALGDSFYEYLLKYSILVNDRVDSPYRKMYDESTKHIVDKLVKRSSPNNLVYIAEFINGQIYDKMDHLVKPSIQMVI